MIAEDNVMSISRLNHFKFVALCAVVLIAVLSPRMASATLGEPEASVQSDVTQLQASMKASSDLANYRVHEIQLPSGTLLREFVAPDGNVFAVAWSGPHMPNLRQALGKYFDIYLAAPKRERSDHKHLQFQQSDLVIQATGHARAFSGRAYLPAAIPSGVNLGDLQ
jgi:hypothetical protein